MYAYYVTSSYNPRTSGKIFLLGIGQSWDNFEPRRATIWVHPDIDIHYVKGDLFPRGKKANLMECPPNYRIKESGIYILARNSKAAEEILS